MTGSTDTLGVTCDKALDRSDGMGILLDDGGDDEF
jgi:hypothetical protein